MTWSSSERGMSRTDRPQGEASRVPPAGRVLRWTARLMFTGLLLSAVGVSLFHLAFALAARYPQPIAQMLQAQLGAGTQVGSFALSREGLQLRLTIADLRIAQSDCSEEHFFSERVILELDTLGSLMAAQVRIKALVLFGARLAVRLDAQGRPSLEGIAATGTDTFSELLKRGRLDLIGTDLSLRGPAEQGPRLALQDVRLQLDHAGKRHSLAMTAHARMSDGDPDISTPLVMHAQLQVAADLHGAPATPRAWSGPVYVNLALTEPASIMSVPIAVRPWLARIGVGALTSESWLRIRDGRLDQTLVRLNIKDLDLAGARTATGPVDPLGPQTSGARIERLGALLRGRRAGDDWTLELRDLTGRMADTALPQLDLGLRLGADRRLERAWLASERLDLADVTEALDRFSLDPAAELPAELPAELLAMVHAWTTHRPRGQVRAFALELDRGAGASPRWRAAGHGVDLTWESGPLLPGVTGLEARVRADSEGGEALLRGDALSLASPALFDAPLQFDRLSARTAWHLTPEGGLHVSTPDLRVANQDARARARLAVRIPPGGQGAEIDLRARLLDGDAARVRAYLPVGIMQPALVEWLARALVSGQIPQADLVLRGPLAHFPFRQREGRFEVLADFTQTVLDYQAQWPPLTKASGVLNFLNESLAITGNEAFIYDTRLTAIEAQIEELGETSSIRIKGETLGPFSDTLRLLGEPPLASSLGRLPASLKVSGDARLALAMEVPFSAGAKPRVSGQMSWPGAAASLGLKGSPLTLVGLRGTLGFSERGLDPETIDAELWGQPIALTLNPPHAQQLADPMSPGMLIQARSTTPVRTLAQQLPHPAWNLLSGELPWTLNLRFPQAPTPSSTAPSFDYQLQSTLSGLMIDLPAPLGKTAAVRRDLEATGTLTPQQSIRLEARLGQDVGASLWLPLQDQDRAGHTPRGRIHLGDAAMTTATPQDKGIRLSGRLAELDANAWRERLSGLAQPAAGPNRLIRPGQDQGSSTLGWLTEVDLQIGRLALGALQLQDAAVGLEVDPDGRNARAWALRIDADSLAGRARFEPGRASPLHVELDFVALDTLLGSAREGVSRGSHSGTQNTLDQLPALTLRVQNLSWGDQRLGTLRLQADPDDLGVQLPDILITGDGALNVEGRGAWRRGAEQGRSELAMHLQVPDLGRLLRSFDAQNRIERAPVDADIELAWPGGLGEFSLRDAHGSVDLRIGAGHLLEIEPGLGRLLGILNLDALRRRLAMDFSDLFSDGLVFEAMEGRIRLRDGQADFAGFTVDSASSRLVVSGPTDLRNERFEQTVIVEPRLGSSVALASAVAGGPLVGAAVYLVDRLVGRPIDRLGRTRYRVSGPWQNPDIVRMGWEPGLLDARSQPASSAVASPVRPQNHFLE